MISRYDLVMKLIKGPYSRILMLLCVNLMKDMLYCCWNLGFSEIGSLLRMRKTYFYYYFLDLLLITYCVIVIKL
jgi:hypothetical protein